MHAYLSLIRPGNCILAALGVIVGGVIALGLSAFTSENIIQLGLAMLVVFFSTAAGNTLNDYTDREVDRINHPERPIPSGKIKPSNALFLSAGLFSLSFPLALFASQRFGLTIILAIAIALMFAYEFKFKAEGLSGNVIVSLLTSLVFVYGGMALAKPMLTIPFALISFLASLYREIVKDIEDLEGDFTRKTLPKKVGVRYASFSAIVFLALAIALSPSPIFIPDFLASQKVLYAFTIALADIVFIYSATFTFKNPRKAQKLAKAGMALGTLSFLLIGLR